MKKRILSFIFLAILLPKQGIAETTASFEVQASIVKGCLLTSAEQSIDFQKHAVTAQTQVTASLANTAQTWNIRCTENLPISITINSGEHYLVNRWRMKHQSQDQYIPYQLYRDNAKTLEYTPGKLIELSKVTAQNNIVQFSIFAVADLKNNNQQRATGIYDDSIAITISW